MPFFSGRMRFAAKVKGVLGGFWARVAGMEVSDVEHR